jgi:hypothetical protein
MALFNDSHMTSVSDLRKYESSILDVAITEGVDVDHKLEVAKREIAIELGAFLARKSGVGGHERELAKVIVTEPLLHWHSVHTLGLVYRDAYNSQLNDRYRGKWQEFAQLSERAQRLLVDIGVGMTSAPIPKAPAPVLGSVAGGLCPATTYFVKIACIGNQGVTGGWSETSADATGPGMRLTVSVPAAPAGVIGAAVYMGVSESELRRQSEASIAPGATWTQPATGLRSDLADLRVQGPDYYVASRREMLRG